MRAASLVLASVMLLACGSSSEPAPATTAPPPSSVAPRWELHEWGLLGLAIGDDEGVLVGVGTGPNPPRASIGHGGGTGIGQAYAPVVYVQLLDDVPEVTFDLRVDLTREAITEAWPGASIDDHGALWTAVHATRATGPCGAVYPQSGDAFCDGVGERCEAAVAASYETSDGACLAIGDEHADFLLYRARVARSALPFDVVREGEALRVVAREGAPAGRIVRLRRSFESTDVSVASFDAPAAGESVVVPELSAAEAEATLVDSVHGMTDEGLTEAEVAAFRTGWRDAIVPEATPTLFPYGTRADLPCEARPTADAIYYWIRGETADHLLPLTVTPAPTAMRRALLVRLSLDAPFPEPVARGFHGTLGVTAATGMTTDVAQRVARRHINELLYCADTAGPWVRGTVTARASILPTGAVAEVTVTALPASEALASCIGAAVRRWTFPVPEPTEGASATFELPLVGEAIPAAPATE